MTAVAPLALQADAIVGDGVGIALILGVGLLGGVAGLLVGAVYRGTLGEPSPAVYPVLLGVGLVGFWLNTASALLGVLGEEAVLVGTPARSLLALTAGAVGALGGARAGDRLAPNLLALSGRRDLDRDVSRVVRTVGRFIAVEVPSEIEDAEGFEPVPEEQKDQLAGRELLFPRGLTVEDLHDRFADRLRDDYGIGHVDAEFDTDGGIEYLAVGRRPSGIGPTLPPGSVAVAIEANPAPTASPGDRVHLWERGDEGARRVAGGELRAVDGDVVTLAVDAEAAERIDRSRSHRLATLRGEKRPEQEFAALLRAARETLGSVAIAPGADLAGLPVGALRPAIVAVRTAEGTVETLPTPDRRLAAGETAYAIGRAEEIRRLSEAAEDPDDAENPRARVENVGRDDS